MAGKSFTRLTFRKQPKTSTQTKSKAAAAGAPVSEKAREIPTQPTRHYRPDICTFPYYCAHNPAPVLSRFLESARTQHTNWKNNNIQAQQTTRQRQRQRRQPPGTYESETTTKTKALPANPTIIHTRKSKTGTTVLRPEWVSLAESQVPTTKSERITVANRVKAGPNWHQTEMKKHIVSSSGWSIFEKIVFRHLNFPTTVVEEIGERGGRDGESDVSDEIHVEKREVFWDGKGCFGRLRWWEIKTQWGKEVCQEVVYDEFDALDEEQEELQLDVIGTGVFRGEEEEEEEFSLNKQEEEERKYVMPGAWHTTWEENEMCRRWEEKMVGCLSQMAPIRKRVRFA